jgi:hypothetical protein
MKYALLPLDHADLEPLVLRSFQYLVTMQREEGVSGVLSS